MTDVCDIEEMFRIIELVPSKNAKPFLDAEYSRQKRTNRYK